MAAAERLESDAWGQVVELPIPLRYSKPRQNGLTMIIDKGMGLAETKDLLELAAPHIDFIKVAFGTSVLYKTEALKQKISLAKSWGVYIYPGGTLMEVAVFQGTVGKFLARARELGFTHVEVSEGTIDLDRATRAQLIRRALDEGFGVFAEIGKKDRTKPLVPSAVQEQVALDLENGAFKVLIEGRDSGKGVGVYDGDGNVREELVSDIVGSIADPTCLIWEAPMVSQQQAFLLQFGPNVNLGNVQPPDIITLESTRVGLRGDSLRYALYASRLGGDPQYSLASLQESS